MYSLQDGSTGAPINSITMSALGTILNSLIPAIVVSDYERQLLIPGLLWGCKAVVDYKWIN